MMIILNMKVSSTSILEVPISPISKPVPLSLLLPLFRRISQPSGHDQQNGTRNHTVDYQTSLSNQNYTLSYFYGLLNSLYLQYIFQSFSHTCAYIPPTMVAGMDIESWILIFPEFVFCQGCFSRNLFLYHSQRYPKLFWRRHFQNLVRRHEKVSNL